MSSEQKGSSISCSFLLSPDTISESLSVQDPTQTLPTDRNQLWRLTHLPLSLGYLSLDICFWDRKEGGGVGAARLGEAEAGAYF